VGVVWVQLAQDRGRWRAVANVTLGSGAMELVI
jgi:hypothetical protein